MASRPLHARNRLSPKARRVACDGATRDLARARPSARLAADRREGLCRLRLLRQALHPEGRPGGRRRRLTARRPAGTARDRRSPRYSADPAQGRRRDSSPAAHRAGRSAPPRTSIADPASARPRSQRVNRWIVSRLPSCRRLMRSSAASSRSAADRRSPRARSRSARPRPAPRRRRMPPPGSTKRWLSAVAVADQQQLAVAG